MNRACKIIATLGPACQHKAEIRSLAEAGVSIFRMNLSYDGCAIHDALVASVRAAEQDLGKPLTLIADLAGPRYRIGGLEGPAGERAVPLTIGQSFRLDQDEAIGDATRVSLPHAEVFGAAKIGDLLRLDDGRVVLRVTAVSPFALSCMVVAGTELSGHKIISLPSSPPKRGHLSQRDRNQIAWARAAGVDWLSASWPGSAEAWAQIRILAGSMGLLAKMESQGALGHLDVVLEGADGLVIARGDLGYDLPPEDIPGWQKRLVRAARMAGKPVIVAAQMLESMVTSPAPTRAEASDVAGAVRDGADALMLSAETAIGAYPQEAVAMMASVIETSEADGGVAPLPTLAAPSVSETIARAAGEAADALHAPMIFTFTSSGSTALSVARTRPKTPIICVSEQVETLRKMQLVWGLACHQAPALTQWKDVVDTAVVLAKDLSIPSGAPLVITAGMPFGTAGSTNILRIAAAQ